MPVLFGTFMAAAVITTPLVDVVTLDAVANLAPVAQERSTESSEEDDEPHCTDLVCVEVVATDTLAFHAPPASPSSTSQPPAAINEPDSLSPTSALPTDLPAPDPSLAAPTPAELIADDVPTAAEPALDAPVSGEAVRVVETLEAAVVDPVVVAPLLSTQTDAHGLNPSYSDETPLPVSGKVMYYAPGVMDRVINYRTREQSIDLCAECVGHVALLRVGDINRKVWIQLDDGTLEGPFLVVDVAHPGDIDSLLARDWVVDVDWETAQRWAMKGPIAGTVLAAPPTN